MDKKQQTLDIILQQGILPLYFYPDAAVSIAVRRQARISAINVSPINRIEKLSGWAKNQKIFER